MTPFTTFKLGVPVLRHGVHVLYATPRTPTPFEGVVLDIIHRFGAAPEYRDWALETVFEDLLCVPDPRPLLSATLLEMKALGIISAERPFDDTNGLAIGALALTERGRKMASEKRLLGRQQEQIEQFAHEPLSGAPCDERRWAKLSPQRPALAIPAEDLASDWPEQAFVDKLHKDRPDWYRADTQIETMWTDGEPEVAWESVTIEACHDNGAIVWRCERQDVMRHLAQLGTNNPLRTAIIQTIFSTGNAYTQGWPIVDLPPDAIIAPLARTVAMLGQQPRLLVSQRGALAVDAGPNLTAPGSIRVRHGSDLSDLPSGEWCIAWNASRDGCVLKLAPDVYSGQCDIASDTEGWRLCRAKLMINGAEALVTLALRTSETAETVFDDVAARLLTSLDHQDTAAGLLLTPTPRAMPALVGALRARAAGVSVLDAAVSWGATLRRLKGKELPGWDDGMSALFDAALESGGDGIGIEEVRAWCEALISLQVTDTKRLVGKLLHRIRPLQSAASLPLLAARARTVAPGFSLPWLPNLYSARVIKEILDLGSEGELTKVLGTGDGNGFDNALRDLWRQGGQLAKRIGTAFPLGAPVPEAIRKLATGRDLPWFRGAVQDWNRRFGDFVQSHALQEMVEGSRLAAAQQAGVHWLEALDRFIEASGVHYEHVFVVDANALIDCPDLPQRLRTTQLLVLPATVIDELDKKKTEPQLRERCTTAVRHLRAMAEARIRFEIADVSLLPDDYRKTADNRILAVALKYANGNVRLVTGDQNLSLKAQAMNIVAVGVERFMDRPAPQRKPGAPGAAQRSMHGNQKKRTGT
jgi:rRNA-processing protein FCF1